MTESEMIQLFSDLLAKSAAPLTLAVYRVEDIKPIVPILFSYSKPLTKFISLEWKIENLTISFFPPSIVVPEEFAIDANGYHIAPFSLDWHLGKRPYYWEMRDDLILTNPDRSHEKLVRHYWATLGRKSLKKEREIFKNFL